ncbi:MAG: hypothetical protein J6W88_00205 [Bacteroidales bacterium]|nr:hypothetical protein [Bacteroidales bacterium]
MKTHGIINIASCMLLLAVSACQGEKKMEHYHEVYQQKPVTLYVAPLNDRSERHAVRVTEDSVYNASLNIAAKQLYLTASDPLIANGYYVPGAMASAFFAATESRSGKQLRNESIADYHSDYGIDAVLFITLHKWTSTANSWGAEIEYSLRLTEIGNEVMHVTVDATKYLPTDFKGNPKPLRADRKFAKKYGCDLETAQRCRLVEVVNQYVLKDLPSGARLRSHNAERYLTTHPEYFTMRINTDGGIEIVKTMELL